MVAHNAFDGKPDARLLVRAGFVLRRKRLCRLVPGMMAKIHMVSVSVNPIERSTLILNGKKLRLKSTDISIPLILHLHFGETVLSSVIVVNL